LFDIENQGKDPSEKVDPSEGVVIEMVGRSSFCSDDSSISSNGTVRVEGVEPEDLLPHRRFSMRSMFSMQNKEDLEEPETEQKNVDDIFTITSVAGYIQFINTGFSSRDEVYYDGHELLAHSPSKKLKDGGREPRGQRGIHIHLLYEYEYVFIYI
jgi:hypothetical protein